jgi:hypothetical protein
MRAWPDWNALDPSCTEARLTSAAVSPQYPVDPLYGAFQSAAMYDVGDLVYLDRVGWAHRFWYPRCGELCEES